MMRKKDFLPKTMTKKSYFLPIMVSLFLLGGCTDAYYNNGFSPLYTSNSNDENPLTNKGFAMLYRGDLLAAEASFEEALGTNARDPYALVGKAIAYENLGLTGQAREVYQQILTVGPDYSKRILIADGGMHTVPIIEYADVRLGYIDSQSQMQEYQGAVAKTIARDTLHNTTGAETTIVPSRNTSYNILGKGVSVAATATPTTVSDMEGGALVEKYGVDKAFANVILRFQTLQTLLQEGLISPQEYGLRRSKNLGALLPLTQSPPSAKVNDAVPTVSSIIQRLRALGRALEIRSISFREHSTEREAILDGLLPDTPVRLKPVAKPPADLLDAASDIRKLEVLRERNLISQREMNKETQAIEDSLHTAVSSQPPPTQMPNNVPQQSMAQPSPVAPSPQVAPANSLPFTPIG